MAVMEWVLRWILKGGHPAAYRCSVSCVLVVAGPFRRRFSKGSFVSCFDTVQCRRIMLACSLSHFLNSTQVASRAWQIKKFFCNLLILSSKTG